jgi:ADP-ribose pyrophosphatase
MKVVEEPLLRKKVVYQGRYVRTEEQTVRLPDGTEAVREIVCPPDAVGILAIDKNETVYLVRQYRPAIRQITLEIPAGIIDPGETEEETARRECQEEIGLVPGKLDFLFSYYHSVGFSTGQIAVFLATDLTPSGGPHPDAEEFLEQVALPFNAFYQKAISGEMVDSKTLLAALWYQQRKRA